MRDSDIIRSLLTRDRRTGSFRTGNGPSMPERESGHGILAPDGGSEENSVGRNIIGAEYSRVRRRKAPVSELEYVSAIHICSPAI